MKRLPRRSVSFWSVQAILYTETITIKGVHKHIKRYPTESCLNQPSAEREGAEAKKVVYREHFRLLLSNPRNTLRNQIILELPSLQGFRTGEVSSFRAEYARFDLGLIGVMDSKKQRLFWNPMRKMVAKHLFQYMQETGIEKGILIRPLSTAPHTGRKQGSRTPGDSQGLSTNHLKAIWRECCLDTGIPVMTPRMGRAFFAVWWIRIKHKSLPYLQVQMRHTHVNNTQRYWEHILDSEDLMAEFRDADNDDEAGFNQGQPLPFSLSSPCRFSSGCPLVAPGCRCRMFQESFEVKQTA